MATRCGGVVLCGGNSSRMGAPKAHLPLDGESMLERTCRIMASVAEPVVVVAAPGQRVGHVPNVQVVRDRVRGCGPLAGLSAGFATLHGRADFALVLSCDLPFATRKCLGRIAQSLENHDAAVPRLAGRPHPLAAVYHLRIRCRIDEALAAGQLRVQDLLATLDTRWITERELADVDPSMKCLHNLNSAADYLALVDQLGIELPARLRRRLMRQIQAADA